MSTKKQRFCVVWNGRIPGVYSNYAEAQKQVDGFSFPQYKSFKTEAEAIKAFNEPAHWHTKFPYPPDKEIINNSICVDGACSGGFGRIEFRCVDYDTRKELFHYGPFNDGTNNIAEFLSIVTAIRFLIENGRTDQIIYSDSLNAIQWAKKNTCRTNVVWTYNNVTLRGILERAIIYLDNVHRNELFDFNLIKKWNTREWGEIPADFGRK